MINILWYTNEAYGAVSYKAVFGVHHQEHLAEGALINHSHDLEIVEGKFCAIGSRPSDDALGNAGVLLHTLVVLGKLVFLVVFVKHVGFLNNDKVVEHFFSIFVFPERHGAGQELPGG